MRIIQSDICIYIYLKKILQVYLEIPNGETLAEALHLKVFISSLLGKMLRCPVSTTSKTNVTRRL